MTMRCWASLGTVQGDAILLSPRGPVPQALPAGPVWVALGVDDPAGVAALIPPCTDLQLVTDGAVDDRGRVVGQVFLEDGRSIGDALASP